ncbi:solute carrier family 35 member G1-like isoform X2 [Tachypleus tridentatus]
MMLHKEFINKESQGVVLAVVAALASAIKEYVVSLLDSLTSTGIAALRSTGQMIFLLPLLAMKENPIWFNCKTNLELAASSLVGGIGTLGFYYGCYYLPVAEAAVIYYSMPIYTTLLGCLVLREKCSLLKLLSLILTLMMLHKVFINKESQGVVLAVVAALASAIKEYVVSLLDSLTPTGIAALRSIGQMIFLLPLLAMKENPIWFNCKTNLELAASSFVGGIGTLGFYYGCYYLPVAEAAVIYYSMPIYTTLLGCLVLREKCSLLKLLSLILTLVGVLLVLLPEIMGVKEWKNFSHFELTLGVVMTIVGALADAILIVWTRRLSDLSYLSVNLWWAVIGALFCLVITIATDSSIMWRCGWDGVSLISLSILDLIGVISTVLALKRMDSGNVSIAFTTEIIFSLILQDFAQRETPSLLSITGAILIIIAVTATTPCTEKAFSLAKEYWHNICTYISRRDRKVTCEAEVEKLIHDVI